MNRPRALWLPLVALLVGCGGPPSSPTPGAEGSAPREAAPPKRITAAVMGDPVAIVRTAELGGAQVPGTDALQDLVGAGLANPGDQGLRPQLAEAVPSAENGLWKVLPDGRMETTWKIKENARWHDGRAFGSEDLLFTVDVVRDPELPSFRDVTYDLIESVEALDRRTVRVRWKSAFIEADTLFTRERAFPLPRHLLHRSYAEEKATFLQLPYWSHEFVGTGPFKLREWVRGSHLVLDSNSDYVLGRPKVDEVEVRFIPDPNALVANFLAGTVELTLGRGLSVEEAIQVGEQWRAGQLFFGFVSNAYVIYPQLLSPNPSVVADVRFRRAMLHAIDRQQMADTFMAAKTSIMHSFLNPGQPEYQDIEGRVPRYDYDPRRAMQIIEGLGYLRGPDGYFRDSADRRLSLELRNFGVGRQATLAVADYWQRVGVSVEPVIISPQLSRDREYRATFPGFELLQQPCDLRGLPRLHSSQAPLPENNYIVNANKARYMNPEFDALLDRFYATVPRAERVQILGQIVSHISDQLNVMGLFYSLQPTLASNRLSNVTASMPDTTQAWNAEQWNVK